jgi:hypothetical protein
MILLLRQRFIHSQILEKAFIYKGKKPVRRAKIYYMQDVDPKFYTIPEATEEITEKKPST